MALSEGAERPKVVVVIATHGYERVDLITSRSLLSVASQTRLPDHVIVVTDDTGDSDLVKRQEEACRSFANHQRLQLEFTENRRTRRCSGTGCWNTGAFMAAELFGRNCFIAILDDDDKWSEDHIQQCLQHTSAEVDWVVSGITRLSPDGKGSFKRSQEPLPRVLPLAGEFLVGNPGVQGSNVFIRARLLLEAGGFDESLKSCTDRDLCVRVVDAINGPNSFACTQVYTVEHFAENTRQRVSQRGSQTKQEGLRAFFRKWSPRMSREQRERCKERAHSTFGCDLGIFEPHSSDACQVSHISTCSDEKIIVSSQTKKSVESWGLVQEPPDEGRDSVLVGVITSSHARVAGLLSDLSATGFAAKCMVVVFVNTGDGQLAREIEGMQLAPLRVVLLSRDDQFVASVLSKASVKAPSSGQLPIALARTVLQVFMWEVTCSGGDSFEAALVIDDDKRLPKGWDPVSRLRRCSRESSALAASDDSTRSSPMGTLPEIDECKGNVIYVGRDIKSAPNTPIFAMRTQFVDLIHNLDLKHGCLRKDDETLRSPCSRGVRDLCLSESFQDVFDCYYDMSSSRTDHLETPVYTPEFSSLGVPELRRRLLVGDPIAREAVPTREEEETLQRGGVMLLFRENFHLLGLEQLVPEVRFGGTGLYTRRSDSLFLRMAKKERGVKAVSRHALAVLHDSAKDSAAPERIRELAVSEICGSALCRPRGQPRRSFLEQRSQQLQRHLLRLRGLVCALRRRKYCVEAKEPGLAALLTELDQLFDDREWEDVFEALKEALSLVEWEPTPHRIDHKCLVTLSSSIVEALECATPPPGAPPPKRIADVVVTKGRLCELVGQGMEGAVFKQGDVAFKVFFDHVPDDLLRMASGATGEDHPLQGVRAASARVLTRRFITGKLYRGGHGAALVAHGKLHIIDIGRDVAPYSEKDFRCMAERAFLSWRFGAWCDSEEGERKLKFLMRQQLHGPKPEGFPHFWAQLSECCDPTAGALAERGHRVRVINEEDLRLEAVGLDDPIAVKVSEATRMVPRRRKFRRAGFRILDEVIITEVDPDRFEKRVVATAFVLVRERPPDESLACSLLMKTCPAEHQTILANVRQLVTSLERTSCFAAVLLLADLSKTHNFLREHAPADKTQFAAALAAIKEEGLVDTVIEFESVGEWLAVVRSLNWKYLGTSSHATHSEGGQQYASTFYGFEQVTTPLLLQTDSDILISSGRGNHDLVQDAARLFLRDERVVTVTAMPVLTSSHEKGFTDGPRPALGVAGDTAAPHMTFDGENGEPFRFEVRCSFLHLERMKRLLLPLCPATPCISVGWYRLLDAAIKSRGLRSLRHGQVPPTYPFFVHPENYLKKNPATFMLLMDRLCSTQPWRGAAWEEQCGQVNLCGPPERWFGERREWLVWVILGRNVPYGRAERCLRSLAAQRGVETCGIILLDDASDSAYERELVFNMASTLFSNERLTLISTRVRRGFLRNTEHCVRHVVADPKSLVATLDLDDFLLRKQEEEASVVEQLCSSYFGAAVTVEEVAAQTGGHQRLSDVAVGGMLRPGKFKDYPLTLGAARYHPSAGNAWQHLRSFAKELFDNIDPREFLSANGEYIDTGADWAFMVPIIEQAGAERTRKLEDWLYCFEEGCQDRPRKHRRLEETRRLLMSRSCSCQLPLKLCPSSNMRVVVEQPTAPAAELVSGTDIVLVVKGCTAGSDGPVHVRLHSECFTGDVLGSQRCDCNAQKEEFLAFMETLDDAVLVYIKGHEGRGNGLLPKVRAYAGMDEDPNLHHEAALQRQDLPSDRRSYTAAIEALIRHVEMKDVVLHTNNPKKRDAVVEALGKERVRFKSMEARPSPHNFKYLAEKQRDMGHLGLLGPVGVLLSRIGIQRWEALQGAEELRRVTARTLKALPFQSFSLMLGHQVDPAHAATGIGGVCFDLNPLLCSLLRFLGFDAVLVRATTVVSLAQEPDHVALVVRSVKDCQGCSKDFWVDVGNSRPYLEPLPLPHGGRTSPEVADHPLKEYLDYRVVDTGNDTYDVQHLSRKRPKWHTNYSFSTEDAPEDFAAGLQRHHKAAGPFRQALRASRWCAHDGCSYTLKDSIGKEVRSDGTVVQQVFTTCEEFVAWIQKHFPELNSLARPAWEVARKAEPQYPPADSMEP